MPLCDVCGSPLRPGGLFCPVCGREAPQAGTAPAGPPIKAIAIAAAAALTVAACVVAVLVVRPWSDEPVQPTPVPPTTLTTPAFPTTSAGPGRTGLAGQIDTDRATVEQVVENWVPQVSSKALGRNPDQRSFTEAAILADHDLWVARYPDAVLLRSEDYSTFSGSGYWVTVVARPFATADQANAWCDAQGIPVGDCFAKFLSHASTPTGSTVHRG